MRTNDPSQLSHLQHHANTVHCFWVRKQPPWNSTACSILLLPGIVNSHHAKRALTLLHLSKIQSRLMHSLTVYRITPGNLSASHHYTTPTTGIEHPNFNSKYLMGKSMEKCMPEKKWFCNLKFSWRKVMQAWKCSVAALTQTGEHDSL